MPAFVALLRGVNVGGVKVEMARLKALAGGIGWEGAKTYIASGNMVFCAEGAPGALAAALEREIEADVGRAIPVLVLTAQEMRQIADSCPFEVEKGNQAHCVFCWDAPRIDEALLEALKAPSEALQVVGGHVWMHHPEGFGTSRLAEKLGQVVTGTKVTARNLNSVRKLAEMVDAAAGA
ncbi:DUF1697 domain-containing protein [Pseudoroseicyclus sp. CXY001]|uniref:DUF1697 domain-containing protein n=1 Tax=Pseudoroseicyclus sp. CXY001 TaxID=3242492 RepID=UPI003570C7F1